MSIRYIPGLITFVFLTALLAVLGKICAVTGLDEPSDTLVLLTDLFFEKLLISGEFENGIGFLKLMVLESVEHLVVEQQMERNIRMFQDKARSVDTLVDLIKDTVRLRVMSLSLNDSAQVSEAANLWNFHVDRGMGRKKGMEVWIAFTSFVIGPWALCDPSICRASYLVLSWAVLYMYDVVPISEYKNASCSFEKMDQGTFVKMKTHWGRKMKYAIDSIESVKKMYSLITPSILLSYLQVRFYHGDGL
ncbi:hypothetical protein Tco_0298539 [Tanacetum coccineum]